MSSCGMGGPLHRGTRPFSNCDSIYYSGPGRELASYARRAKGPVRHFGCAGRVVDASKESVMAKELGRSLALSPFRRLVADLMRCSQKVPAVTVERRMD